MQKKCTLRKMGDIFYRGQMITVAHTPHTINVPVRKAEPGEPMFVTELVEIDEPVKPTRRKSK